jgi:hypothetical protein
LSRFWQFRTVWLVFILPSHGRCTSLAKFSYIITLLHHLVPTTTVSFILSLQ